LSKQYNQKPPIKSLSSYLDHSKDINTSLLVILSHSLGAQESSLLSRVPVELNRTLRTEARVDQSTEDFQDGNGTGTIIVSTGGATPLRQPHVDRILMSTNKNVKYNKKEVNAMNNQKSKYDTRFRDKSKS
jgi:hypothetical protein